MRLHDRLMALDAGEVKAAVFVLAMVVDMVLYEVIESPGNVRA